MAHHGGDVCGMSCPGWRTLLSYNSFFPNTREGNTQRRAIAMLTSPLPDTREWVAAPRQWQSHGNWRLSLTQFRVVSFLSVLVKYQQPATPPEKKVGCYNQLGKLREGGVLSNDSFYFTASDLARCIATSNSFFPNTREGDGQRHANAMLWQTATLPDMREWVATLRQGQCHGN